MAAYVNSSLNQRFTTNYSQRMKGEADGTQLACGTHFSRTYLLHCKHQAFKVPTSPESANQRHQPNVLCRKPSRSRVTQTQQHGADIQTCHFLQGFPEEPSSSRASQERNPERQDKEYPMLRPPAAPGGGGRRSGLRSSPESCRSGVCFLNSPRGTVRLLGCCSWGGELESWWPPILVHIPAAEVPAWCLCAAGSIRVCHWEIGFLEGLSQMPLLSCFMVRYL